MKVQVAAVLLPSFRLTQDASGILRSFHSVPFVTFLYVDSLWTISRILNEVNVLSQQQIYNNNHACIFEEQMALC